MIPPPMSSEKTQSPTIDTNTMVSKPEENNGMLSNNHVIDGYIRFPASITMNNASRQNNEE
jgi:hypothetical protein